ncbi:MAG: hypothetical protein WD114_01540, partial [Phycisphaerales bacterium]
MPGTFRTLLTVCTLLMITCLGHSQAKAQALEPEHMAYSVGGWYLIEIKDTTDAVMGFWGIPIVEVEVGNIRRLWFEALPNDEWGVWAFEPVAISEKAAVLAAAGASPDSLEFMFFREFLASDNALNLDVDGGVDGPVVKGFIEGDPMTEPTGSLEDPDLMVNLLADIGYPVAPGMSGLLVNGTAGSGMNMNQQTKQLLNCLRSTTSSCGECICVRAEGEMIPGPWIIMQTLLGDGRLRCEYSRTEEHRYWQWGENEDTCEDCTRGSAEHPIIYHEIVEHTDYWYDIENCPDDP